MGKHKAYQSIFNKLSELKPELASKYCITGYIYPTFSAKSAHWIIKEQEHSYNFDNYPSYDIDILMDDVLILYIIVILSYQYVIKRFYYVLEKYQMKTTGMLYL